MRALHFMTVSGSMNCIFVWRCGCSGGFFGTIAGNWSRK